MIKPTAVGEELLRTKGRKPYTRTKNPWDNFKKLVAVEAKDGDSKHVVTVDRASIYKENSIAINAPQPAFNLAVFEDVLLKALDPFIKEAKEWYLHYYDHIFTSVGSFPVNKDRKGGLCYRFCMSEKHSAIKGMQAFCFVSIGALNLPRCPGGVRNLVYQTLGGQGWFKYGDMYIIIKSGLASTANSGMFIAFLTEHFYNNIPHGRYLWLDGDELEAMARRIVLTKTQKKVETWLVPDHTGPITGVLESDTQDPWETTDVIIDDD